MSVKYRQILEGLKNLGKRIKKRVSSEFLTYLVFFVIAVVIWYLNALNKDYTTDLKFKVKYVNLPTDKVLVEAPGNHLSLTVSAQGFTLLKYRLGFTFYPVNVDAGYSSLRKSRSARDSEYYILSQTISDKISTQLSSDIRLQRISPDTLKFLFSEMVQKEIPVKVQSRLQFEKEFLPVGDIRITPSRITVSGPRTIVDTIQYVHTKNKTFKRLKDTLQVQLALQPVEQLSYSVNEVSVVLPIERHTEASVSVPIEAINLPQGLTLKTFPGTVTVNCLVPISSFEKIQPHMFRAVVDYDAIKDAKDGMAKAKVSIAKSPSYVSDIRFNPKNVDFIIEK
jgi:YbbR domain-containing protein